MKLQLKTYHYFGIAFAGLGIGLFFYRKNILNFITDMKNAIYINELHPKVKDKFVQLVKFAEDNGYKVKITSGYRSFEKQAQLHAKNHKNAVAGHSAHNYGMAIDINLWDKNGKWIHKSSPKSLWESTGVPKFARSIGMTWGGDYKNYKDNVHFQLIPNNKRGTDLLALAYEQYGKDPKDIIGNRLNISSL